VLYSFTPKYPGLRMGAVQLVASGAVVASNTISGMGYGSLATFPLTSTSRTLATSDLNDSSPPQMAVNGNGDVFLADEVVVEKLAAVNGVVPSNSTFVQVGTGIAGARGVAVDGSGNIFVAQVSLVKELPAVNGVVASSTAAVTVGSGFNSAGNVAVDGQGNVFVADFQNKAVYEIVAGSNGNAPGVVSSTSTVIPVGSGFTGPISVAVDGYGNVFVGDNYDGGSPPTTSPVKQIVAVNGAVTANSTVSPIGSSTSFDVRDLALDGGGNLFLTNNYNNTLLQEFLAVNGVLTTSSAVNTIAIGPTALAYDGQGHLFGATTLGAVTEYDLTTPSLSFGTSVPVGGSSTAESVTLQNEGSAPLVFATPSSGYNPATSSNFTLLNTSATTCPVLSSMTAPQSIAESSTCVLSYEFTPVVAPYSGSGVLTGTSVFTDNSASATTTATQSISLSGTATASGTYPTVSNSTFTIVPSKVAIGYSATAAVHETDPQF
jgi:hypothetical protein